MSLTKCTNDLITINNHLIEPVVGSGPVTGKFYTLYTSDSMTFSSNTDAETLITPVKYNRRYAVIEYNISTSGTRSRVVGFYATGIQAFNFQYTWMYVQTPYSSSFPIRVISSAFLGVYIDDNTSFSQSTGKIRVVMDLVDKKVYVKNNDVLVINGETVSEIPDRGSMSMYGFWSKVYTTSGSNTTTISNLLIGEATTLQLALGD